MDIKEVQLELKSALIPLCISLDWSLKDATMVVKWVEVISEVLFLIFIIVQYASAVSQDVSYYECSRNIS